MSIPGLPFPHSIAGAVGASNYEAIAVDGIRSSSVLLAVIQHNASDGTILGLDPSDWTASDGSISANVDTYGDFLIVIYSDGDDDES